jgi:hypothetical protein
MIAALAPNETQRLEALRGYRILDTPAEAAFDDLVQLAAIETSPPAHSLASEKPVASEGLGENVELF